MPLLPIAVCRCCRCCCCCCCCCSRQIWITTTTATAARHLLSDSIYPAALVHAHVKSHCSCCRCAYVRACVRACIPTITGLCVCARITIITACSPLVQVDHPDFIRRITLDGQAVDAIVVWLSKQHGPRFVTGFPC